MKPHEILEAIGERLSPEELAYWNGLDDEGQNEAIVIAQRHGIVAAVRHVAELARD